MPQTIQSLIPLLELKPSDSVRLLEQLKRKKTQRFLEGIIEIQMEMQHQSREEAVMEVFPWLAKTILARTAT